MEKGKVAPVCGLTAPATIIGIFGEKVGGIESIFPPLLPAAHTRMIPYCLMSSEIRYLNVSEEYLSASEFFRADCMLTMLYPGTYSPSFFRRLRLLRTKTSPSSPKLSHFVLILTVIREAFLATP